MIRGGAWPTASPRAAVAGAECKRILIRVLRHTPALAAAPYPIEALPDAVREAVLEVQCFLRAPVSMVATSALSAGLRKEKGKGKAASADSVAELAEAQRAKPEVPRMPQMFYEDTTPEAIAWGLAKKWPSAAIMAAEGGIVLGGHGMGKETLVRNLALLNVLWDGAAVTIDRRSKESFRVAGALNGDDRGTPGLAVRADGGDGDGGRLCGRQP